MSTPTKKPVNYLNNKDILKEIHSSKNTYCYYEKPEYDVYDLIIDYDNASSLNNSLSYACKPEVIQRAIEARAEREGVDPSTVKKTDVIYRVMTWDHIPVSPKQQQKKVVKTRSAREIIELEDSGELDDANILAEIEAELEDPELLKEMGMDDMIHIRVNFPPFQHYKFDENDNLVCVGLSHWKDGKFSKDHGQITNKLAKMYLMLCDKYAMRYNWRGYCVDASTDALTQRGWIGIDSITSDDKILSYKNGQLTWSKIRSVYRAEHDGPMFHLTVRGYDTLITPNHKLLTDKGLVPVDFARQKDRLILCGSAVDGAQKEKYSNAFVELCGWIVAEGCYEKNHSGSVKNISVYQNPGLKADRIRNCLQTLGYSYSENLRKEKIIQFRIHKNSCSNLLETIPEKQLTMDFILKLTVEQRMLLMNTMIDGDGHRRGNNSSYTQKSDIGTEMFVALCSLNGIRTVTHKNTHHSFGKQSTYNVVNLLSQKYNSAMIENINFHGGKRDGRKNAGLGKITNPNEPTVHYTGRVWCPETEHGCFFARRNGTVYLTGNSYVDEMRGAAVLQLTYVGLRFNESKSSNPFAYYTAAINNSFRRVLNMEKRNQTIRDDILEMNNLQPSWTRQNDGGHDD